MKKIIVITVLSVSVYNGKAQTSAEWFSQKKTQIKYLSEQIAALQMYTGYVKKGYSIAHKGLSTIGNIKHGDFNLHSDFFASLKKVNPKIKNYSKVADIISYQIRIVQTYKSCYKRVKECGQFTDREISYIYSVFTKLLDDTGVNIDELLKLIAPDEYQMKDDERLSRIDLLYNDFQDKYNFEQHFANEAYVLAVQRIKEKQDAQTSRALYSMSPSIKTE